MKPGLPKRTLAVYGEQSARLEESGGEVAFLVWRHLSRSRGENHGPRLGILATASSSSHGCPCITSSFVEIAFWPVYAPRGERLHSLFRVELLELLCGLSVLCVRQTDRFCNWFPSHYFSDDENFTIAVSSPLRGGTRRGGGGVSAGT